MESKRTVLFLQYLPVVEAYWEVSYFGAVYSFFSISLACSGPAGTSREIHINQDLADK